MQYRPDIDGLRAAAVMPVILSHAGFDWLQGGFLGVDVFFVISGYLITHILMDDIQRERFNLLRFYERRVRRILPALLVVMLVSTLLAYQLMLPDFLENFGQSLVATSFFSNNILLLMTSGYWDLESEFKPLLHTWSLGVEEQFYLLFPVLLFLLRRLTRDRLMLVLGALALLSLGLAEWMSGAYPNASFYLLPTRAWELLLGALAALLQTRCDQRVPMPWASRFSLAGAALLAGSYLFIDPASKLPGLLGLAPTLGAALLLLFVRPGTLASRGLSLRPMVFVGLISYSAYLWHQPLMAFSRIGLKEAPTPAWYAGMVVLTLALAWLTWRIVEQPMRQPARVRTPVALSGIVTASMAVLTIGLALHKGHGMPERMYTRQAHPAEDMYIEYNLRVRKLTRENFDTEAPVRMLVLGNSYARDFVNMVNETMASPRLETVYREFNYSCSKQTQDPDILRLIGQATLVVMASGDVGRECLDEDIAWIESLGKQLFVLGTKHFGYNLNWLVRVPQDQRAGLTNALTAKTVALEFDLLTRVPAANFVPLMTPVLRDGRIPVTDDNGDLLSADRAHLTKQGALYFGERVIRPSRLGQLILGLSQEPASIPSAMWGWGIQQATSNWWRTRETWADRPSWLATAPVDGGAHRDGAHLGPAGVLQGLVDRSVQPRILEHAANG